MRDGRAWRLAAVAALATVAISACTADDPTVPTAAGTSTATDAPTNVAAEDDPLAQELQFVACMREKGVTDMPDPEPGDTSGFSSVRQAVDVLRKGSDPVFQAALDECKDLLPPAQLPSESPEDTEARRQFASCMRENGLPEFPDPQGGDWRFIVALDNDVWENPQSVVEHENGVLYVNIDDPVVGAAWEKCYKLLPSVTNSERRTIESAIMPR